MERWNSLSGSKKGLLVGVAVIVLVLIGIVVAYTLGLRCGREGNYLTCSSNTVAPVSPSSQSEDIDTESGANTATPLSESSDRPEPVSVDGDAVVVNDQPAGPIVEVTMLTLSEPGWVAVYEDNNGTPGNVLGAARFEEGIHLGEISLLRSTEPGKTYYLILHADTNNREFDLKKNPLVVDANGTSIRSTFRTFND